MAPKQWSNNEKFEINLDSNQKKINWEDGYSWCPDKPGLGVEFDIEIAENSYSDPSGWPAFYERNDGAFTNW